MQPRMKPSFDLQAFLDRVGLPGTPLEYGTGQVVFRQGESAKALFYIQKGGVKLSVLSGDGKEAVIAILEMGEFFGVCASFGAIPRPLRKPAGSADF